MFQADPLTVDNVLEKLKGDIIRISLILLTSKEEA